MPYACAMHGMPYGDGIYAIHPCPRTGSASQVPCIMRRNQENARHASPKQAVACGNPKQCNPSIPLSGAPYLAACCTMLSTTNHLQHGAPLKLPGNERQGQERRGRANRAKRWPGPRGAIRSTPSASSTASNDRSISRMSVFDTCQFIQAPDMLACVDTPLALTHV